jgi:hypothetical protein
LRSASGVSRSELGLSGSALGVSRSVSGVLNSVLGGGNSVRRIGFGCAMQIDGRNTGRSFHHNPGSWGYRSFRSMVFFTW